MTYDKPVNILHLKKMDRFLGFAIKLDLSDHIKDFNILEEDAGYEITFKDTKSLKTFTLFFGLCFNMLQETKYKLSCQGTTIQILN